jgi:hypothetical protein
MKGSGLTKDLTSSRARKMNRGGIPEMTHEYPSGRLSGFMGAIESFGFPSYQGLQ